MIKDINELIQTREDWEMMDEIMEELQETMPHDTEEQRKLILEEARQRFITMLET